MRKLNMWLKMMTGVGATMKVGRDIDRRFRYYVLEALNEEGLFAYLEQPRTYGQILAQFSYVDSEYTRAMFDVLVNEKQPTILKEGDTYRRNPEVELPRMEDIASSTDKRYHNFGLMAKGMTHYIPSRLRAQIVELGASFEEDGRQLMTKFDKTLGARVYTASRNATFALLTRDERQGLRGSTLLEVGCGSGRETAEIWLHCGGEAHITAIDPVPGLLDLARRHFADYLDEMDPGHPPLTDANRPKFEQVSVTHLPYDDNTFDAAFHAFVLHWTSDPRKAIAEVVRVLKPGGLAFGIQPIKPAANPYFDIVVRTSHSTHGYFWKEELRRWYAENGVELEIETPVAIFRGHKPLAKPAVSG